MRLLVDTQALLWFVWNHTSLSATGRTLMVDPANALFFSAASFWEIAIKVSVGKLTLGDPFEKFITEAITSTRLTILPIEVRYAGVQTSLPFHHRDPFDRMLAAQSLVEGMPLVSADVIFDAYAVQRLW